MVEFAQKRIDDMEATFGGAFKLARAELGVEAFGFQVMDLPPNLEQFPEHDHAETGQEEVYVVLHGSGEIEVDGERHRMDSETITMVGPTATRKIFTGDEPMRVLAIGGTPGKAYQAPETSKLGTPDPLAQS